MKKLSLWLYQVSKGWMVMFALVIFLAFGILFLPGQSEMAQQYSGGMGSPDTSFFYSGSKLYQTADAFGEIGRRQYLYARWTFDLVFPLVYTFFLASGVSWSFNRFLPFNSKLRLLNLIPFAAMAADYFENSAASIVFASFPIHSRIGELLAPIFTPLKWILITASFIFLIAGILHRFVKKIPRSQR